jgi:hypothetical protein
VNEAFSAVPLRFMRELDLDPEIVNVNGGAIAMGTRSAPPARCFSAPSWTSWSGAARGTAWPPSASAAAWASPPSSKGSELIRWDRTDDGIVILTLDDPSRTPTP